VKSAHLVLALLLTTALTGCGRRDTALDDEGRYSGIGIYQADGLWKHVQGAPVVAKAQAALKDDSQIIVVVDRRTGEIRQCGNHSGFCIAMNPWQGNAPRVPARLDAHADEIQEEGAEVVANNAVNAAE